MAEFEEMDYNSLMLPGIMQLGDKENALEKYPSLKKYKEFSVKIPNFNKVLKYISLAYDGNSPMQVINSIPTRKIECLLSAGFTKNDNGKFTEQCEGILKCSDPQIVAMIMRYIRMQKNPDFAQLVVYQEAYHNQLTKMLTDDINIEKTKEIRANINGLREDISNLTASLLNQDTNRNLEVSLYDELEEEELIIRPENMSKALKENKDIKKYLGDAI